MRFDLGWRRTLYSRYSWLLRESMFGREFRFRFSLYSRLLGRLFDVFIFLFWRRRLVGESRTRSCPGERFWGQRSDITGRSRGDCAALAGSAHWQAWKRITIELVHVEGVKQVRVSVGSQLSTHLRCRRHESACPGLTLSWLKEVRKGPGNKKDKTKKKKQERRESMSVQCNASVSVSEWAHEVSQNHASLDASTRGNRPTR